MYYYISAVEIDNGRALSNVRHIKEPLYKLLGCKSRESSFIFRVLKKSRDKISLLMYSDREPCCNVDECRVVDSREWDFQYEEGSVLPFSVVLDMVKRDNRGEIEKRRRVSEEESPVFLRNKLAGAASVVEVRNYYSSPVKVWHKNENKKGSHVVIFGNYEGVLKVENSEKFRQLMINGIGRSKNIGCGLIIVKK